MRCTARIAEVADRQQGQQPEVRSSDDISNVELSVCSNVGKSTHAFHHALTRAQIAAENYPFCNHRSERGRGVGAG